MRAALRPLLPADRIAYRISESCNARQESVSGFALHKVHLHETEETGEEQIGAARHKVREKLSWRDPSIHEIKWATYAIPEPVQQWVLLKGTKQSLRGTSCAGGGKLLSSCLSNKQGPVSNPGHAR